MSASDAILKKTGMAVTAGSPSARDRSGQFGFLLRRCALSPLLCFFAICSVASAQMEPDRKPIATWTKAGVGGVTTFAALRKDGLMAFTAEDGVARVFDPGKHDLNPAPLGKKAGAIALASARNGEWVVICYLDGSALVYDMAARSVKSRLKDRRFWHLSIAPGPDRDSVLFFSSYDKSKPAIHQWNIAKRYQMAEFEGHKREVTAVAVSDDGRTLVSGDTAGEIIIWDVESGKIRHRFEYHADRIAGLAFLGKTARFVACSSEGQIAIRDAGTGRDLKIFHHMHACAVGVSSDGKRIATGNVSGDVMIWDYETAEIRRRIAAHSVPVAALAFSDDGSRLVTACAGTDESDRDFDAEVKIWSAE
jgi:hypothetical protein